MSLIDVIGRLATGTYTVTRIAEGTAVAGRYQPGAPSTFSIVGSVQPVTGRKLQLLREGQHASEVRIIFTTTELRTRTSGNDPDVVTIDGEDWVVSNIERWQAFGNTHYEVLVARREIP